MAHALDRSLDDILADRKQNNNSRGSRGGGRRRDRQDYPRDGVRKPFRDDAPRNLDSEWVHDKFEDYGSRRSAPRRRHSPEPSSDSRGTKIRVDNLHYELTQEDLEGLFSRIGPLIKLEMKYDRAGRSEGTAFVTYESHRDATAAIREFDGANAAGQPIRLTLMPSGPSGGGAGGRRNPFDTAVAPGRPLAERITVPGQAQSQGRGQGRSRSLSPRRESDEEAARRGVDRYRPRAGGSGRLSRSRSPVGGGGGGRRREGGGRRPGARREGGGGGGGGGGRRGGGERNGRPKKTQEELDAEMADYFAGGGGGAGGGAQESAPTAGADGAPAQQQQDLGEDIDMIE